jgi:hypothetical protein
VGTAFPGLTTVEVHGFIWSNGAFTMIDVPGFERTQATGINNLGQVVGYANMTLLWGQCIDGVNQVCIASKRLQGKGLIGLQPILHRVLLGL